MMQTADPEDRVRTRQVQELCAQLTSLVALSQDQRRKIDSLLTQLLAITREASSRMRARGRRADLPDQ